jgi:enterochelin esterase family protein
MSKRVTPLALAVLLPAFAGLAWAEDDEETPPDSPRLAALARAIQGGDREALGKFWAEVKGKAPLVEPVDGDKDDSWVTFVWRGGDETRRVHLLVGLPDVTPYSKTLERLKGTDLWYRTEKVPNRARFGYSFLVNFPRRLPRDGGKLVELWDKNPPRADPLNPRGGDSRSIVELPQAPAPRWTEPRKDVPKGVLREHTLTGKTLKRVPRVWVYTPAGYDPRGEPCAMLVVFDGVTHGGLPRHTEIPTPTIVDNLTAEGKVPRTVVVLIDSVDAAWRHEYLGCSSPFADFLAGELVPWVRSHYRVSDDPARAVLAGESDGGLAAAHAAFRHPEVFGCVLSQSGSFGRPGPGGRWTEYGETGWLIRQFVAAPKKKLRFYLTAGQFEHYLAYSVRAENRRMRDVLEAKGYPVTYVEFVGGHEALCWRGLVGDGLVALLGAR